jgi:hypothetical protein
MGTWIEFRCENRTNPSSWGADGRGGDGKCESHDNNGPMELARDTRKSVLHVLRLIEKDARANGWTKTKYGWICAFCAAQPSAMDELEAEAAT